MENILPNSLDLKISLDDNAVPFLWTKFATNEKNIEQLALSVVSSDSYEAN